MPSTAGRRTRSRKSGSRPADAVCAPDCAGGNLPRQQGVRSTAPWGRIALVAAGRLFTGRWKRVEADAAWNDLGKQTRGKGVAVF